nr:MAG TPA: hypothetical protein [Caudoviricetes sp.]
MDAVEFLKQKYECVETFIAKPAGYTVGICTASTIASFIPMKLLPLWRNGLWNTLLRRDKANF